MPLRFKQVDVFATAPFRGNPVAVVLGADALDSMAMQRIANWTNLSETTFTLRPTAPGADYRVRIFTPRDELPFAGHPTLGTLHALLEAGLVAPRDGSAVQECGAGLVALSVTGEGTDRRLALELPATKQRQLDLADAIALESILGAPIEHATRPLVVDVGPVWAVVQLPDAATVVGLEPDMPALAAFERQHGVTGVTVFGCHPPGAPAQIEVRSFAPSSGVAEDPVCGSGNGSVAVFLRQYGLVERIGRDYVASQGCRMAREGRVAVQILPDGRIRLGGSCLTCVDGVLNV